MLGDLGPAVRVTATAADRAATTIWRMLTRRGMLGCLVLAPALLTGCAGDNQEEQTSELQQRFAREADVVEVSLGVTMDKGVVPFWTGLVKYAESIDRHRKIELTTKFFALAADVGLPRNRLRRVSIATAGAETLEVWNWPQDPAIEVAYAAAATEAAAKVEVRSDLLLRAEVSEGSGTLFEAVIPKLRALPAGLDAVVYAARQSSAICQHSRLPATAADLTSLQVIGSWLTQPAVAPHIANIRTYYTRRDTSIELGTHTKVSPQVRQLASLLAGSDPPAAITARLYRGGIYEQIP